MRKSVPEEPIHFEIINIVLVFLKFLCIKLHSSDAASGWAGWALAHPEFGSSVNPITTRGADYAHHITASPPGFENPAASLLCITGLCINRGIL